MLTSWAVLKASILLYLLFGQLLEIFGLLYISGSGHSELGPQQQQQQQQQRRRKKERKRQTSLTHKTNSKKSVGSLPRNLAITSSVQMQNSVTRFTKISPLCQNVNSLWQFSQCLPSIWQIFIDLNGQSLENNLVTLRKLWLSYQRFNSCQIAHIIRNNRGNLGYFLFQHLVTMLLSHRYFLS